MTEKEGEGSAGEASSPEWRQKGFLQVLAHPEREVANVEREVSGHVCVWAVPQRAGQGRESLISGPPGVGIGNGCAQNRIVRNKRRFFLMLGGFGVVFCLCKKHINASRKTTLTSGQVPLLSRPVGAPFA